jgi:hypothetical protein
MGADIYQIGKVPACQHVDIGLKMSDLRSESRRLNLILSSSGMTSARQVSPFYSVVPGNALVSMP